MKGLGLDLVLTMKLELKFQGQELASTGTQVLFPLPIIVSGHFRFFKVTNGHFSCNLSFAG